MSQPAASSKKTSSKKQKKAPPEAPPEAPWGKFPLVQIAVFIGIVLLFMGLFTGNRQQMIIGLGLACLGGLELTVREHFAGYRSHTSLLGGLVFVLTTGLLYFVATWVLWQCLVAGIAVGAASGWLLLRHFEKVSGGLRYRLR